MRVINKPSASIGLSFCCPKLALLFLPLALISCSNLLSSAKPQGEEADKGTEIKAAVDKPEDELFYNGKNNFRSSLYTVSRDSFQGLRDGYPLGPYAEYAEIKIADSHFETSEFETAAGLYEEFAKSHPASTTTPYAILRAARSHQLANRGVGRDPQSLQRSLDLYDKLISQYPNCVYIAEAKELRDEVRHKLAAHEKSVIDFYRKKDKEYALKARERDFEAHWGMKSEDFDAESILLADEQKEAAPSKASIIIAKNTVRANKAEAKAAPEQNLTAKAAETPATIKPSPEIEQQPIFASAPQAQTTPAPAQDSNEQPAAENESDSEEIETTSITLPEKKTESPASMESAAPANKEPAPVQNTVVPAVEQSSNANEATQPDSLEPEAQTPAKEAAPKDQRTEQPTPTPTTSLMAKNVTQEATPATPQAEAVSLRGIECDTTNSIVIMYLSGLLTDESFTDSDQTITPLNNSFNFAIPGLRMNGSQVMHSQSCFGSEDLLISKNGIVHIKPPANLEAKEAQIMQLDNPPRLVIGIHY